MHNICVSGTSPPEDNSGIAPETEYLEKVNWLWQQLSPSQKSKIIHAVTYDTIRQGSGKHCFIAEAISANRVKTPINNNLLNKFMHITDAIFYDGPSYDFLLATKISSDDRKRLNDIYYARIGVREHQYHRATELIKIHVASQLIMVKESCF